MLLFEALLGAFCSHDSSCLSVLAGDKQLTTTGQFVIRLINILGVANFRTSTLSPFLVWISSRNSVFASLREKKFYC